MRICEQVVDIDIMGLLDELDKLAGKKQTRVLIRQGQPFPKTPWGTRWVTPQQAGRLRKQQQRQILGFIIAVIGWAVAGIISSAYGVLALPAALVIGVLFTVWGVVTAFSKNDDELKRHAWKAWREFKSLFKRK